MKVHLNLMDLKFDNPTSFWLLFSLFLSVKAKSRFLLLIERLSVEGQLLKASAYEKGGYSLRASC